MSTTYTDLTQTNFPDSVDNITLKSNITNASDAVLIAQIQSAILAGDFSTASKILQDNQQLNGKIFTANDYNQLRDAIIALERFYKNDITDYINDKQTTWETNINQFSYQGVYSSSTQYYQNNMVNYTANEGTFLYLCIKTPPTGILPTNTSYWRVLTLRGERGQTGVGGMAFTYLWDSTRNYALNDIVVYGDGWWGAIQPNINQTPQTGSPYWQKLLTALSAVKVPVQPNEPTNQTQGDQWYKTY